MGGFLSPTHWILLLIVALVVFGPKKLPEIGKSIGDGLRELKKASKDLTDSINVDDTSEHERR